ncbi:hypothetical protein QO190_13030 [Cloacibacterium sp. Arc13]
MYLEFLGLKREASYCEKDLEAAIITHLQDFLLEFGNEKRRMFYDVLYC